MTNKNTTNNIPKCIQTAADQYFLLFLVIYDDKIRYN